MSSYLYFQHLQKSLIDRFGIAPEVQDGYELRGLSEWRELITRLLDVIIAREEQTADYSNADTHRLSTISELSTLTNRDFNIYSERGDFDRSTEELIAILLLLKLRKYEPLPKNDCPRLFVSHRSTDRKYALTIAKLAHQHGFAYWVDVLDPYLQSLHASSIPNKLIPIVKACIIEFALINCSHVIACLTEVWRGSMWVPYEYGRITDLPSVNVNACAWVHPDLPKDDFPEYMWLGEIAYVKKDIEAWLDREYSFYGKANCPLDPNDLSILGDTEELPELSKDELYRQKLELEECTNAGMPTNEVITAVDRIRINKKNS